MELPLGPKWGAREACKTLQRPKRPFRGSQGSFQRAPGALGFQGPLESQEPLQIAGVPKAKASDLGHFFEDFQAIKESLYLRGTQLEPTKSLCKLKIRVLEFGGPSNSYIVVLEAPKTLVNFCNSAKNAVMTLFVLIQKSCYEFVVLIQSMQF